MLINTNQINLLPPAKGRNSLFLKDVEKDNLLPILFMSVKDSYSSLSYDDFISSFKYAESRWGSDTLWGKIFELWRNIIYDFKEYGGDFAKKYKNYKIDKSNIPRKHRLMNKL